MSPPPPEPSLCFSFLLERGKRESEGVSFLARPFLLLAPGCFFFSLGRRSQSRTPLALKARAFFLFFQ